MDCHLPRKNNMTHTPRILFVGTEEDKYYLQRLKPLVGTAQVTVRLAPVTLWTEISFYCKKNGFTGILSTSTKLLSILSGDPKPSLDSYAGSYFKRDNLEVVFLDPLPQLVSVPYGPFVTSRYCSKLCEPWKWNTYQEFSWTVGTAQNFDSLYHLFQGAAAISIDIETYKEGAVISSIAYTGIFTDSGASTPELVSFVVEPDSPYNLTWIRKFNALKPPKIFQNGKYDCSYLLRYNAAPANYLFDTANAMHCWYSELPKDLATLSAFFHREGRYWKNMAAGDHETRLQYNCRDTYATAIVMCEWLLQAPKYAVTNYLQEFPLVYPCLLAEMTGIKRDMEVLSESYQEIGSQIAKLSTSLNTMLGIPAGSTFNVNSPIQMKQLLGILGCKDIAAESCDEKHLASASFRHPINQRILDQVLEIRGLRKLNSTYLTPGKEFNGRILYALNPHSTDTGRLASKEHHFWCGLQIQNIPRGKEVKRTLCADPDFVLFECDLEQAESRDTGYIAGDEGIIEAVSGTKDFHSVNASAFFGVPYEDIYDSENHKTRNKTLRDTAKRVNHGANYNMGASVLVDTMGLPAIYAAAQALKLPTTYTPQRIAEYLLGCFHKVYPGLKNTYYPEVVSEIITTKMLTSRAIHHSPYHTAGWTRYCFSDPTRNKRALNAYVAHPPQSLNAMTLNKAFLSVFYDIAIHPIHRNNFRLLAQIHDSLLFQTHKDHTYLAEEVKKRMEIPVTIKGYDGKTRTFTVPAALKAGKDGNGVSNWSLTE